MMLPVSVGSPGPLGAKWTGAGVNFALWSQHAERVELCLFDSGGGIERARVTLPGRTGHVRHGFVPAPQAGVGTLYGYRVHGPWAPEEGQRFDATKLLLDPQALAVVGAARLEEDGPVARRGADSAASVPRSRVIDARFDWSGDRAPHRRLRDTIIYELHVKGFTQLHPEVPPEWRGRYLGLTVPAVIGHLQKLGVTAVELLPCQAFATEAFLRRRGLRNFWGYNPLAWSAPEPQYAVADPVAEFRQMVQALHAAGIEVILDVVYNHTAEGDERGPTLSLRGIDNAVYYRLQHADRACYENLSGCGNAINADHPAVVHAIVQSLRHWAEAMRVDGFRFDLGSVLARGHAGFDVNAPIFAALRADPVLATRKLIAEPWDVGHGGYQLGNFPPDWSEWNDRYRDTVRAFWRGERRMVGALAERIAGSSDLFRRRGRKPHASINYVTSHDGFTLRDLVSYDHKHNEANLEANGDGHGDNLSWNGGVEGPSDDPGIEALRRRRMRSMLATLLLSHGVPMLQAGDELGRTQGGNNNAYCQDNEISWIDWGLRERDPDLLEFVRALVALRHARPALRRDSFLQGVMEGTGARDVHWLHPAGREMTEADWHDPELRSLGVLLTGPGAGAELNEPCDLLALYSADARGVTFGLPSSADGRPEGWRLLLDSSRDTSGDGGGPDYRSYALEAFGCAILQRCSQSTPIP